jgi:hypothetical protein
MPAFILPAQKGIHQNRHLYGGYKMIQATPIVQLESGNGRTCCTRNQL